MADAKRRKTRANEFRLVLVLLLIGWKSGASFLSQSCSIVIAKPITLCPLLLHYDCFSQCALLGLSSVCWEEKLNWHQSLPEFGHYAKWPFIVRSSQNTNELEMSTFSQQRWGQTRLTWHYVCYNSPSIMLRNWEGQRGWEETCPSPKLLGKRPVSRSPMLKSKFIRVPDVTPSGKLNTAQVA